MMIPTNSIVAVTAMVMLSSSIAPPTANAFIPRQQSKQTRNILHNDKDGNSNDPTKVWYAAIADTVQNILTNSPLNEGKKALVRKLAGEYDAVAVRAKLEGLIANEPVLMLSFVKWPFCIKAKAILDELGVTYTVIEVDEAPDGKPLRAEMAGLVGRTSVPGEWNFPSFWILLLITY